MLLLRNRDEIHSFETSNRDVDNLYESIQLSVAHLNLDNKLTATSQGYNWLSQPSLTASPRCLKHLKVFPSEAAKRAACHQRKGAEAPSRPSHELAGQVAEGERVYLAHQ